MFFQRITYTKYCQLTNNADIIKYWRNKPAILCNDKQQIIKLIYRRKRLSLSRIWPYALRFKINARQLQRLGIDCPVIDTAFYYPELKCHLLMYPMIPGDTLMNKLKQSDYTGLAKLPTFIAKLHTLGVHFHDLHSGNIIQKPDGGFALIDIITIKTKSKPLTTQQRARNLAHMLNKKEDYDILTHYGMDRFVNDYLTAAELITDQRHSFLNQLNSRLMLSE